MMVIPRIILEVFVHFSQSFASECSPLHLLDLIDFMFEKGGFKRRGEIVVQTNFDLRNQGFLKVGFF